MVRLLSSLQFRLVAGFALVLSLALVSVSIYVGRVADREAERLQQDIEEIRAARIQDMISSQFQGRPSPPSLSGLTSLPRFPGLPELTGLQGALEQIGSLYHWRIVVNTPDGRLVADSHTRYNQPFVAPRTGRLNFPIVARGQEVASVIVAPNVTVEGAPEPTPSRVASALNRSLLWTGLAAGFGGLLLVSVVSRRVLTPVRRLTSAARRLGQGDLSQRVSAPGHDEIGDLGRTFNSMAEELERAEQQRRNLMADVAHELRSPLSNIQGYLEALRDGLVEPDATTIDAISRQTSLLSHLVEDLRVLALAEAGVLRLDLAPASLQEVLHDAVDSFRPRAQAKGIDLSLDVATGLPTVEMDRARIAQVLGNLMDNAITHTPDGGRVTVSAGVVDGAKARVTIADSGAGIPPEDIPLVFERFYRVDPSRSRATGGAGLGLTIARQLVESHGGRIFAESTPGEGSRFIFELPLEASDGPQGLGE